MVHKIPTPSFSVLVRRQQASHRLRLAAVWCALLGALQLSDVHSSADAQTQVGADDFRISFAGPNGSTVHDAAHDGIAHDPTNDRYLVVWDADDRIPGEGATFNGKREVFGRLLDGDGTPLSSAVLLATSGPADDQRWDAENPEAVFNSVTGEFFVVFVSTVATGPVAAKQEIFIRRVSGLGQPVGDPIRVTQTGIDGNLQRDSREPSLAFNSTDNEVLVVWQREESDQGSRVEHEIYAQRVGGTNGALVGGAIRVSSMGPDGSTTFDAFDPDVTWAPGRDEYLVVWRGDDDRGALVNGEFEIFAQRLDGAGNAVGADDVRISHMGPDGQLGFGAEDASVAYNADRDEWMVAWTGTDDPMASAEEVFAQRLSGPLEARGVPVQVSRMGPDGDATYRVDESQVIYHQMAREYFLIWIGEDDRSLLSAEEFEVFGQRLDEDGVPLGLDDVRLSSLGPDGNSRYDVFSIGLEYNSVRGETMVVFSGDDDRGSQVDDEVEIFGQRVLAETPGCVDDVERICLTEGRFEVSVDWRDASGTVQRAQANRLSGDTGWFWFFDQTNAELVVKVLDARGVNGRFWVFFGALSDVEYVISVTDTATGEQRTYANAQGTLASRGDTEAFPIGNASRMTSGPTPALRSLPTTVEQVAAAMGSCTPSMQVLCLNQGRFRVEVAWTTATAAGSGEAEGLTDDTGWFWFFDPANTELIVKVLDARAINGAYWVFFGALSDVQYDLTVTDTTTGERRTYRNPAGTFASVGDVNAFQQP